MKRRAPCVAAGFALLLLASLVSPAVAIEEADRLWLVGERAFADALYPVARRALERFVAQYPKDSRLPEAVRTRLLPPVHGDSSGVRGAAWLWEAA